MPTLENYTHADTPHEKTVQQAGYRYGCHNTQRGGRTQYIAHPWARESQYMAGRIVVSDWLDRGCGHTTRSQDAACEGCEHRGEK